MSTIPLASFKIRRFDSSPTESMTYFRYLYVATSYRGYETIELYSNTIQPVSPGFNPYGFTNTNREWISEIVSSSAFWNSESEPTFKGHPRFFEGIFPSDTTNVKFIALISGEVGTTSSKREVGYARIGEDGTVYAVSETPLITCASGESIINGSVVYFNNNYQIFLVRKRADDSTRIEHWITSNLTIAPTFYKTVDVSTNHSSNNGSIYNGGFLNVSVFEYENSIRMMVTGINNYQYAGLMNQPIAEGDEQVTVVGWYKFLGNTISTPNAAIVPDYVPSVVGPVIMPFPISSESIQRSSQKMFGPKGNIIVFSENGRNYIILGFSGCKYVNVDTYEQPKSTVWIYELNLL